MCNPLQTSCHTIPADILDYHNGYDATRAGHKQRRQPQVVESACDNDRGNAG
jgi:hypothetical protein